MTTGWEGAAPLRHVQERFDPVSVAIERDKLGHSLAPSFFGAERAGLHTPRAVTIGCQAPVSISQSGAPTGSVSPSCAISLVTLPAT